MKILKYSLQALFDSKFSPFYRKKMKKQSEKSKLNNENEMLIEMYTQIISLFKILFDILEKPSGLNILVF